MVGLAGVARRQAELPARRIAQRSVSNLRWFAVVVTVLALVVSAVYHALYYRVLVVIYGRTLNMMSLCFSDGLLYPLEPVARTHRGKIMWALVVAAVGVTQSFSLDSGSGSGYPANTLPDHCENYKSYWIQSNSESGFPEAPNEYPWSVPTAAGNLITYLAAQNNATVAYPYNYDLDQRDQDLPQYNWLNPTGQPADKYFLGGQRHGKINNLNLIYLMKTDNTKGTELDDARSGLQQYLDNTNRLGKKKVVQVLQASDSNDFDFIGQFETPYLLHIKLECLLGPAVNGTDYVRDINGNIAFVTLLKSHHYEPPAFHKDLLGHTIVVYDRSSIGGVIYSLKGASGLYESRTNNERGCDETTTKVFNDQTCIEGVTYITLADDDDKGLSTGAIVAIAVGAVVVVSSGAVVYKKWPLDANKNLYAQFI